VRASVQFRRANLVAPDFLQGEERYHVIFCRNLLIYLDASARHLALANLRRLLRDDGLLYVGHVEAASVPTSLFRRHGSLFPFAFQPAHAGRSQELRFRCLPQAQREPLPRSPQSRSPR
jgi:chemotaxis protein methyltransferase WspC